MSPTATTDAHETAFGEAPARLIEDVLAPTVAVLGYEVILVEWLGAGRGRIVRVYLDHPDGVTLDDCARMTRIISDALDAAEADPAQPAVTALLSQPYTLEVSSPGIERPLCKRSHFARHTGKRAVVRTALPLAAGSNQRTFHGIIVQVDEDPDHPGDDRHGVVALRDTDSEAEHRIPIAAIRRANLVYEG
ncbi:MAG TPA: ribosome maturation factor RimP [Nannocystaceae bacterium]|nr:ribosome maturation factor RimP [Nannocystaceae bacterium]